MVNLALNDTENDSFSVPTLHHLWFSTQEKSWCSLALVPVDLAGQVCALGEHLVAIGRKHGDVIVRLVEAVGARPDDTQLYLDSLRLATVTNRIIVAVDPIAQNPSALPIIRAASAVILVTRIGESRLSSARNTVRAIGRDRVLGTIVLG
jgi:hypothetical protein